MSVRIGKPDVGRDLDSIEERLRRLERTTSSGAGGGGGSDVAYLHIQSVAASTWTINHNLNKYPSVTPIDSAGNKLIAGTIYDDADTLRVTFAGPTTGTAALN